MAKSVYDKLINFNTYKQAPTIVNLTSLFNGRVGDQGLRLATRWLQGEEQSEVKIAENGMFVRAYMQVGGGTPDGLGGIMMNADADTIIVDGDKADVYDHGIAVLKLPKQMFPQDGFAKGYFALVDDLGNIWSSVDVWYKVQGGVPTMGLAAQYYVTKWEMEIDQARQKNKEFSEEMRKTYNLQVTDAQNALTQATSDLSHLSTSVGAIQAQIDAGNVVTLARHIDDYKDLNSKIDNQLAQMDMQVETFENLDTVKTAYPEGKEGIFLLDDGHRAVYRNGQWIDAGVFQASTIKDGDVFNSELKNANYFTDPTFTVDKPFTDDKTVLTVKNINGTNWLHVESSTGGGIGLEAHNTNDDLFQIWAKRLQFDLSNHTTQYQSFNLEVQIYNVDDNTTVTKSGIGTISVKPLTAYHANLKFTLPTPSFANRYYRIFIYSNSTNADYDIANPVLRNDYVNLPEKNNLIDTTNQLSSIGSVSMGTYYNAGKHYCTITSANAAAESKGAQQIFRLEPYGSGYGDKFRVKTEVRNEGTPGIVIAELRYLNADGSIGSSQLISRTVLATSQSVAIDRIVKLSSTENAKDYRLASLAIYVENSSDAHLLINLDKTSVSYEPNVYKTKDNLFGNWATNHVISDGSTATDYYNDAQVLDVYLAGSADYSTLMLPMSYNSKGMIDIDIKLLSSTEEQLKFELNEYNTDGSIKHINELRQEKLLPGIARNVHITYDVTEIDGSYYALVIYSQKQELSFTILDAKAQLHDTSRALEAGSLPQVNLLANLDEGGAIAQGKVELIRGNTSHLYYATFKIQGQSTKTFPKKAWRITFYTDDTYKTKLPVRVFPDYPDVDSLNMKSNYIDWTQANNILISRFVADLTKVSNGLEKKQMEAPNQCEITGEPCLGFNNGQKLGLFTLSPKKSNTMFNMKKGDTKMAVFEGNNVAEENCFKADSTEFGDDKPFTIEATDDDVDQSLKDSFNALLKLVNSSTDDDFKAQIDSKLNLQSVANWIVTVIAFGLYDDTAKNICWATWDGVKWSAVQYDHDMAFGLWWDGSKLNHEEEDIDLPYLVQFSKLFNRLLKLHLIDDQLIDAWNNLKTVHPMAELQKEFRDWYYKIGDVNYEEDQRIWPDMPGQHYFHGEHVLNYIAKRYKHCDKWFTKDYLSTL